VKIRRAGRFAVVGLDVLITGSCSLLLARRVGRRFFYVGRVEWGATRSVMARIRQHCTIRSTPACTVTERAWGVVWIEPDVLADVTYSELRLGRLRDPVLRGIQRVDWRSTQRLA
jgi:ATP-dependent DNA ligase